MPVKELHATVNSVTQASDLTDSDISFISDLAVQAGRLAVEMREGVDVRHKSGPWDKVTAADLELSRILIKAISERFPKDEIISEEDAEHVPCESRDRVWLIDPIDGTNNYVSNDGQYSVMIGLLVNFKPIFGWVYAPAHQTLYFGGPEFGSWTKRKNMDGTRFSYADDLKEAEKKRLIIGKRDRKSHPWIYDIPNVEIVKSGSVGLKVARILDGEADMYVHLAGKLKVWDTAGPAAIALGAGLEVGRLEGKGLPFDLSQVRQNCSVIIGRPGTLSWTRIHLQRD
jgi:3'(2'), 5'-bisphosphate nucleotidase